MPTIKTNFLGEANNWKRDLKNCYKNSLFGLEREKERENCTERGRERNSYNIHRI